MKKQLFFLLVLSGSIAHAMDQVLINIDGHSGLPMDEAVKQAVEYFENQAVLGNILDAFVGVPKPCWFKGDQEKTKRVVRSLLAMPSVCWKPASKEADLKLISALRENNIQAAQAAIDQKADVNCYTDRGGTPLSMAIDHLPLVKLLLDNGADADMTMGSYWTPLAAATYGYIDTSEKCMNIVKLLLERGAHPKITLLGNEKGASPVSAFYLPQSCVQLMQFVLSHVSIQDIEPVIKGTESKEQVVDDIIETRKLLIALSVRQGLWKFNAHEPYLKELKDTLSLSKFDENYRGKITQNVEALLVDK